jgi:hypothetical protein
VDNESDRVDEDEHEPIRDLLKLKAVYDDDLVAYLRSLGLRLDGPRSRCKFCRTQVTLENLAALFPESGTLKVVCHRRECLLSLQELIRDGVVNV